MPRHKVIASRPKALKFRHAHPEHGTSVKFIGLQNLQEVKFAHEMYKYNAVPHTLEVNLGPSVHAFPFPCQRKAQRKGSLSQLVQVLKTNTSKDVAGKFDIINFFI